jgi:excisionase family DNA binding protein
MPAIAQQATREGETVNDIIAAIQAPEQRPATLTLTQAAFEAGVSEATIRRYVRSGSLAATRFGGRGRVIIRRDDLRKLLDGKAAMVSA